MKKLVIAEKPSVAGDLAKVLGRVPKTGDFYENDEWVISSALGHLVELKMPQEIDKAYSKWTLDNLPIIPKTFGTKPVEKTKKKLQELKKLMKRPDVGTIINACDAGREGELIFTLILDQAKVKKDIKRLWMMSMTPDAIRRAFEQLREGDSMQNLQDAARSRQEADWLVGLNATRGATVTFGRRGGTAANVGRVQTPTLAMVCDREKEIRNFVPRSYWEIIADFSLETGTYKGTYQRPGFKKDETNPHDRVSRIWEKPDAERIAEEVRNGGEASVTEKKKRSKQAAPRLYDLTTLQREANNRYGFSAANTLSIAQALYERHKMLTYPRTDSRALPEDYGSSCRDAMAQLPDTYKPHVDYILSENRIDPKDKRVFNNKKISDHFAIIPTDQKPRSLNDAEQKIYDMVVRRFLAVFHPPAEYDVTTRESVVAGHTFRTDGKVLAEPGWLAVYGKSTGAADTIPALPKDQEQPVPAGVDSVEVKEDQTRPPPRYSEATLLSAMENAGKQVEDDDLAEAMRERGLGTPATRAGILDNLVHQKYLEKDGKELLPSPKGEALIDFLRTFDIEHLTSPALTGEWEYRLKQVEEGHLDRKEFMKGIEDITRQITDALKNPPPPIESSLKSITNDENLQETFKAYVSTDTVSVNNRKIPALQVNKVIGNRAITEEEVAELLEKKQIGPLDGFRSKMGKAFSAILKLVQKDNGSWRVELDFGDSGDGEAGEVDISNAEVVGECPICGAPVHEAPNAYICAERAKDRDNCDFQFGRNILGKTIERPVFQKLLTDGKTDLVEGFRSNRTKRKFDAFLVLKEKGKLGFEFPPRPAKKAAKKATKKQAKSS
ncbi:DNA topoisomerase III [Puniceicoccus vermicola]|uniref:DNA topoisomerase n=1 Tax=Puniceicoccus vermicola TaxID=388746 RepID=A0A7X1B161_9BACT|nr:DNA topoisomerase III [Puniceicoccus vermicola]MBC2603564.1 DNA topoisomerase III [Puniceicoccus vermicola]